jgi:hypothetical protein
MHHKADFMLKMAATCSSETLLTANNSAWRHNPKDRDQQFKNHPSEF